MNKPLDIVERTDNLNASPDHRSVPIANHGRLPARATAFPAPAEHHVSQHGSVRIPKHDYKLR